MKALGTCKGCGRRRLINALALCKRCNKDPTQFLSKADIKRVRLEQEAAAAAAREQAAADAAAAEAEAAEAAAKAAEEGVEEGAEIPEGEEGPEGEGAKPAEEGKKDESSGEN